MSSEKKAIKALLKSFKKVKSISLIDKVNKKGKTISKFLFALETKEGKKSKLEKWLRKLEDIDKDDLKEKDKKKSKDKKKVKPKKVKNKEESKDKEPTDEKPQSNSNAAKTTVEKVEREKEKKDKGIILKPLPDLKDKVKAGEEKAEKAKPTSKIAQKTRARKQPVDNLKIIIGIGPAIEKFLKEAEIDTFEKLAQSKVDDLKSLLVEKGGTRYNANDPSMWPAQAELAASGKKEELKALQSKIKEENKLS
ncbi:hypothetical protein [Jiulongibacter sediminis]|uniref:hypothetical protein n=1 Tax=Jiulongibacter sediminis TaxID=1605367 RepID=UPI00103A59AE|nr:hypothetical protein [Jiulongibacter sediminis]